jgi:hypothetical protein
MKNQLGYNLLTLVTQHMEWGEHDDHEPLLIQSNINIIKMIFFLRMNQVSQTFHQVEELMHNDETFEGLLALVRLTLQIFFITHLFCCLWNYAAYIARKGGNRSWQDAVFYSDVGTNGDDNNNNQQSHFVSLHRLYLYSFYWSLATVITVGYGDISPKNDNEVIISSLAMLFGSGFFAYGINKIGAIFEKFEAKNKAFK